MQQYYEAELRKLRETAMQFAERHPEQAQMLGLQSLRDRDPYIERLLEGVAYLTAKLQQRMDDDIPEISASMLEQLCPQLLRHIPSLTIAEFGYRPGQLQKGYEIAKNSQIHSDIVGDAEEQTICYFRTTQPVMLLPLQLTQANSVELEAGGTRLQLCFTCDSGVGLSDLSLVELPLYLHADPAIALNLRMALVSQVKQVRLQFPESEPQVSSSVGKQECVVAKNFATSDSLLPQSDRSFSGFQFLLDFFALREKYYFIALKNLNNIAWPVGARKFIVDIDLDAIFPKEYQINKELFKLYCTPAVNLFEQDAEPFTKTILREKYPLIADARLRNAIKLFSLDGVVGLDERSAKRQEYSSMSSFLHRESGAACYQLSYHDEGDETIASSLTFSDSGKNQVEQTISCAITASNGYYPRRHLQANAIKNTGDFLPGYVKVTNLTRPTTMLCAKHQPNMQWLLLSGLSLSNKTLTDLSHLKSVLTLYDWSGRKDNHQRIQGISQLQVIPLRQIYRGAMQQGLEVNIVLQESNYESIADAHLFGELLHKFNCQYVAINYFIKTIICCHPSGREFKWQTHQGQNIPL